MMSGAMHKVAVRTAAMASKEVMHILRDRQMLVFALGMPVLLIFLFGYAVTFDVEHIPLIVVDNDHTAASRALVERFSAADTFRIVTRRDSADEVETIFRFGGAKAALVIPAGYERHLLRGGEVTVQLLLDGSDNTTASIALGYADALTLLASRDQLASVLDLLGGELATPVDARFRTLFNPALRSAIFLVPGLMVVILVIVAVMLTALTVAREYERGSMEQLFATPVGRAEVVLGKLGPYFVLGIVQVLLVVTFGVVLFDVPVRGSLPLLFGTSSVFLLAMLMQGLFISTITRNQMVASQVALMSTFLPALLLSGFSFPIETMPWALQLLASALPARYFVHALRAIMLRGNGLDVIAGDLLAMGLFFLVVLLLAVRSFRRTVA